MHFQKKVRPAGALLFDAMFHIESGCGFMRFSDGLGGDSGYTGVWRHIVENNTTGTNFGTDSDLDVAKNLGACPEQHTGAYFRVPVTAFFSSTSESDFVKDGDVIVNDGGFSGDKSGSMIEQYTRSDAGSWMNVDGKGFGDQTLQVECNFSSPLFI